jgi:methylated-DNA-[protein]-cysteine S-methyltransferase
MVGRGYTIFDTAIGRCGIVWSNAGILGVQLPETREIDTRRRLLRLYDEAREQRPSLDTEIAIDAIAAMLRGQHVDFTDIALDMQDIPPFSRRVYEFTRTIPRGETRTYDEVARALRITGAAHSVAGDGEESLHDHRALPPRAGSRPLCRPDVSIWRQHLQAPLALARGHGAGRRQNPV